MKKRVLILMLDSLGIGYSKDAEKFGDVGANTLLHIAENCKNGKAKTNRQGALNIPNLTKLGLPHALKLSCGDDAGLDTTKTPISVYGCAKEVSNGKDTPSGHWEMAGVPVLFDWGYFLDKENSFPKELTDKILKRAGIKEYLGNCHSSGTEILDKLGEEHMKTGYPIFYTSADSVFQIACHEETFGLDKLYELCKIAREEIMPYNIGRIIARPFVGKKAGEFERTGNRHDYTVEPPEKTLLERLYDEKYEVISVGKIADIFAHRMFSKKVPASPLEVIAEKAYNEFKNLNNSGIVFANLVDFDSSYGHRRDVSGYAKAIEWFDSELPKFLSLIGENDILIITADHGNDPTWHGTDHTREHVPVIFYSPSLEPRNIGMRETFADTGQTIADFFGIAPLNYGKSFLKN